MNRLLSGIAPALTRFVARIAGGSGEDVCQDVLLTIARKLAKAVMPDGVGFYEVVGSLKGDCWRTGVTHATNHVVLLCDADLPVTTDDLRQLATGVPYAGRTPATHKPRRR